MTNTELYLWNVGVVDTVPILKKSNSRKECMMKRYAAMAVMIMIFTVLPLLLGGCAPSVSVQTKQYLGLPAYPPTDPASVEILREPPVRPHERLGEIALEPQNNPPVSMMEEKLRDAAAQMGANAVVLVADRTMRMGAIVTGPWYGRQIDPQFQRIILGVAIRYTK
jgi:hypothetical protein